MEANWGANARHDSRIILKLNQQAEGERVQWCAFYGIGKNRYFDRKLNEFNIPPAGAQWMALRVEC